MGAKTEVVERFKRMAKSKTLIAIAILLAIYPLVFQNVLASSADDRLRDLGLPQWIIADTKNIPHFFASTTQPDVLVMGSSLILSPAYKVNNRHTDFTLTFLENEVTSRIGKQLTITNVGVAFAMASDQYLLFKEALARGKKPKFVVYAMAPRDFVDNSASAENSPMVQILASQDSNRDFFPKSLSSKDVGANLSTHQSIFKSCIRHLRSNAADIAARFLNNQTAGPDPAVPHHTREEIMAHDVELYETRYNPPNYPRLKEQISSLNQMLELCHRINIPVLLVNMPITQANKSLIAPDLSKEYFKEIENSARRFDCKFANLDGDQSYTTLPSNFDDSVHLSAIGGRKFFKDLAKLLASDPAFLAKFKQ
ncbi:hypothetical protein BH10CYA1_BH10CYA1_43510 [soil metagenome]